MFNGGLQLGVILMSEIKNHPFSFVQDELFPEYREVARQLQKEFNYRVLGQHMKSARVSRHMTQAQVAEMMRLGVKYYASLESGATKISLIRFIQFIEIMQVSADSLLMGCIKGFPAIVARGDVSHNRQEIEHLLDQCSEETLKTIRIIAEALLSS